VVLVWSMWSGYWTRDGCAMREWAEREGIVPQFVHSGGHAWPEDLRRLVDAVEAKQTVWVHTDAGSPSTP
jgi:mRNA degradation ribonuclease J1/J2